VDRVKHPAPFSRELLPQILDLLDKHEAGGRVLDPFAGIGRGVEFLWDWGYEAVGVELEPEWATQSPHTIIGDATKLPFADGSFAACVSSPCFANRMADSHFARDKSRRQTYTHVLGRQLSENSAGKLQWGEPYRDLHLLAWSEVRRVLEPNGLFVLNLKDHIRAGERQHVTNWHYGALLSLGFEMVDVRRVATPHFKFGANRDARLPERLLVFRNRADFLATRDLSAFHTEIPEINQVHDPSTSFVTEKAA
jgi:SAM-dependent methyltransferase